MYQREPSRATALFLVIVAGVELDLAEQIEDTSLPAPRDVFLQRFGNGRLLCPVFADLACFLDQLVVNGKVGSNVSTINCVRQQ
jgi:hypothetical protein